ncbi:carbohydrate ABC transporter permease [Streptomyces sp. NBC_01803]|uniref:carbohydrate ABC transporter permease n=1 Tax=Streptomyces sp. NBC_01803 TaxID=2975946 RepID=UPI002DD90EFA|nr:carbohydrate ABC transporter permease [Streptomyces sp. NBC_01803]WSA42882.1 carbohydrate ABC transporter permease [Streptomyces sp. NBC_01803]
MSRPPRRRRAARLLLIPLCLLYSIPLIYLLIGSLKPPDEVLHGLSGFVPTSLTFDNYRAVFDSLSTSSTGYFWQFAAVSLTVSAMVVAGGLLVNSMAAYALSRLRWPGRRAALAAVLLLMLVPFESVAVPLLYLFSDHRDTLYILVLPFIANAFSIYQFHTYFRAIPRSVEESAVIDGAGPWRTLFGIVYPMSKPVFASVAILTFLVSWGSFLWPVLMISDPSLRPLPLEMTVFQAQQPPDWGQILAFGVLLILPVLLVFLLFQRWVVRGVVTSVPRS